MVLCGINVTANEYRIISLQVLMRALRDFNTPKIVTDDVAIFMGLIGDLFPALDVPRKRDPELEEAVKNSMVVRTCTCIYRLLGNFYVAKILRILGSRKMCIHNNVNVHCSYM